MKEVLALEKLYTLTLYYLAQCYIHKGDAIKSAVCCHTTLKRQLEINDYNNSEWSLNMATLSQVCLENNAFHLARECLTIASKIYADYEPILNEVKSTDETKYEQEHEKWRNVGADIDRCWGKYGLILLTVSKERLMADDDPENMKQFEPPDELKALSIGVDIVQSPITANYVLTFSDAIKVFNISHKHLQQAQGYYSLSEHATDHARVVQEISRLYHALVFFVESSVELAEIGTSNLEDVSKHFGHTLDLLDNYGKTKKQHPPETNEYPSKYSEEWEKPVLLAFFYSARLLTKIITSDKTQLKNNQVEALNNYKYIIEYCTKNKEAAEKFATELSLCQEMVKLLHEKWRNVGADIDRCWGKYGLILLTVSKERLMADDDPENMKQFEPPGIHEKWRNVGADIDRCWGKYGLILLTVSKERLMADDDPENMKQFEPPDELKALSIGVDIVQSPITANYGLTFSDAIKVFNISHKHLQQAQGYYSLSEHATDHARVVQEISRLYHALVFFVETEAEQCKFHKRRITELEKLVKQFNPKFYVTLCREIWYELGEVYSDMYELKHEILVKTREPTQHQVAKINWLIKNSLTHYIELIQSFKDVRTNEYPSKYSEEWEKPVLLAFFYSARLLTKIITSDKTQLKNNQVEALNNYKYIIEYCTKNKEAAEKFATELSLCQEMVKLLPMKIEKIAAQITA
ncbi:KIF1-binding protein-like [Diaphorina citri]|uniref:KIF-binding protein n=1 Tax=Diaphorina citri TaxID=121845 RepID=A0A3Q0J6C4_DIACI|nr:KIF1-binding protein-like [Diaphorina citri]